MNLNRPLAVLAVMAVVLVAVFSCVKKEPFDVEEVTYSISGTVVDTTTLTGLDSVTIAMDSVTGVVGYTNSSGEYYLGKLESGYRQIYAYKVGYDTGSRYADPSANPTDIDFYLKPAGE